jgi:hypothetical protein
MKIKTIQERESDESYPRDWGYLQKSIMSGFENSGQVI